MNDTADQLPEQLSAFMDGELGEAESRFLLRRLEHDVQARNRWHRMHLASACLKRQPWQPAQAGLAQRIAEGIAADPAPIARNRPVLRWAAAASFVALAVLLVPRLMPDATQPASVARSNPVQSPTQRVASPASADLVGVRSPGALSFASDPTATVAASDALAARSARARGAAPAPVNQSPEDFPLVDNGDPRTWPRSGMAGAGDNPALEAYLVRHNQMLAGDGLGGFVPYVDVVTNDQTAPDQAAPSSDTEAHSADGGAAQQ